jgi:hypothetical protein
MGFKGSVFPLVRRRSRLEGVNQKLSDNRIRATCRELLSCGGAVSGRSLREELRRRFGAAGKTERVFRIHREVVNSERAAAQPARLPQLPPSHAVPSEMVPSEVRELQQRLLAAESAAAENLARAERAEYREQAHQERWAAEIDRLRQAAQSQPALNLTIRNLQEQVFKLSRELDAARGNSAV